MESIASRLPSGDGVAAFNRMYLEVTKAVGAAIAGGLFANSAFLDHLDVVFANHYLAAVSAADAGGTVPRCWDVLCEVRSRTDRAQIQFAIAGMNAHINHDLVLSLVETFEALGLDPDDPDLLADFDRVNSLLASLDAGVRRSFERGFALELDEHFGGIEDCVDGWSISQARAVAWHDARLLWRVRDHERMRSHYEALLDEATAAAGRCLLLPFGSHEHSDGRSCAIQAPILAGRRAQLLDSGRFGISNRPG